MNYTVHYCPLSYYRGLGHPILLISEEPVGTGVSGHYYARGIDHYSLRYGIQAAKKTYGYQVSYKLGRLLV